MKQRLGYLGTAATLSLLIMLPFLLLEWLTRSPVPGSRLSTFGVVYMWLVPTLALFLMLPLVQTVRAGNRLLAHPAALVLRVVVAGALAWSWVEFMLDQLPCLLGATGC